MKAWPGALVEDDVRVRSRSLEPRLELGDVGYGNERILVAEKREHRTTETLHGIERLPRLFCRIEPVRIVEQPVTVRKNAVERHDRPHATKPTPAKSAYMPPMQNPSTPTAFGRHAMSVPSQSTAR